MTLLVTALAGDGIVMGADSALYVKEGGEELVLTGFPKIIQSPRLPVGISISGYAKVSATNQSWVSPWLESYLRELDDAGNLTAFVENLVTLFNDCVNDEETHHTLHIGAWVKDPQEEGRVIPYLVEVSRKDGKYSWKPLVDKDFADRVDGYRKDKKQPYPVKIQSAGFRRADFENWARKSREDLLQVIGANLPYPEITAIVEYVRFLIETVANLYRIARRPGIVAKPVTTFILPPEGLSRLTITWS